MKTITLLLISIIELSIKVKTIVDDISEKMPDQFNMHDIMAKCEERTPYIIVCFQVNKFSLSHKYSHVRWLSINVRILLGVLTF